LEKIKKAAIQSYSSRSIIESDLLRESKCVLLVRDNIANTKNSESWDISNAGLVMLLFKQDYGDAFTYRPVYVNVKNTVASTKAGTFEKNNDDPSKVCQSNKKEKDKCAKVNIAVAMSLKAINAQGGTLPKLSSIGEGVTSIPSVEMKQDNANSCVKIINDDESNDNEISNNDIVVDICHHTDLMPYPNSVSSDAFNVAIINIQSSNVESQELGYLDTRQPVDFVSLTFAVTETGVVGFDIDQAISENKAIKEALGPAISDSLKELLSADD